jgi:hypothetical protein
MAAGFQVANRVLDTTTDTASPFTILGSFSALNLGLGYQTLAAAFPTGAALLSLCIADASGANWETGLYTLAAGKITRTALTDSSNKTGGVASPAVFAVGTRAVFTTIDAATLIAGLNAAGAGATVALNGNYSLIGSDGGKTYAATTSLVITLPAPGIILSGSILVDCPSVGTVTVTPPVGVTLNGLTGSQLFTRRDFPTGFAIVPHAEANAYGITPAAGATTGVVAAGPVTVGRSAVPFIVPGTTATASSISAAGVLTLATPLPRIYSSPGAYVYFGAAAINTGQAAGWYPVVFSSTTVGQIYNNPLVSATLTGAVPWPTTLTPFGVIAGSPTNYQQSQPLYLPLPVSWLIKAGSMTPDSSITWDIYGLAPNINTAVCGMLNGVNLGAAPGAYQRVRFANIGKLNVNAYCYSSGVADRFNTNTAIDLAITVGLWSGNIQYYCVIEYFEVTFEA